MMNGSTETSTPDIARTPAAGQPLLLERATPTLYRTNAFRLLGLPVGAGAQDIRRQADRLRMSEALGAASPQRARGPLPLETPTSADDTREALQRLVDPERRLLEELFWFWPADHAQTSGKPGQDVALSALGNGDVSSATRWWEQTKDGVAVHNLAVLAHVSALDLEALGATRALTADEKRNRDAHWEAAFRHWKAVAGSEEFWSRFSARVRDLNDIRLTTGTGRRIRLAVPLALLRINAVLAVRASERGKAGTEDRNRHLALMRRAGFDAAQSTEALRMVLEPVREHIKEMCRAAKREAETKPKQGAQTVNRLLDQSAPLLVAIDCLPDDHPSRELAHDEVAMSILRCQIEYGSATEDWTTSHALLLRALAVAVSANTKRDLQTNIDIVVQNIEFVRQEELIRRELGTCWFCLGTTPPDEAARIEVKMHGDVTHEGTTVRWNKGSMYAPRCANCKGIHDRASTMAALAFWLCAISGFAYCGTSTGGSPGMGIAGLVLGLVLAVIVHTRVQRGIKPTDQAKKFPMIQRRLQEGWALGEKPPGVQ